MVVYTCMHDTQIHSGTLQLNDIILDTARTRVKFLDCPGTFGNYATTFEGRMHPRPSIGVWHTHA